MHAFFLILLLFKSCVFGVEEARLNETQKEAVREYVRHFLNMPDLPQPDRGPAQAGPAAGTDTAVQYPRHMLELYQSQSQATQGGRQVPEGRETIRSIEPIKDFVPHFKDILVFNMSGLTRSDKLRSAHLHIHRRRLSPPGKRVKAGSAGGAPKAGKAGRAAPVLPPPCRVRLYQLLTAGPAGLPHAAGDDGELSEMQRTKLRSLDSVLVTQATRGGWHTIDISMALKEMLNSPSAGPTAIFGVRFEGPRGKVITAQHFLKDTGDNMPSSFIVVYSEDNLIRDGSAQSPSGNKMSQQQMQIMSELLKKAGSNRGGIVMHDKSKQSKTNIKKFRGFESDPIRHERKYYRESHTADRKKEFYSNDVAIDGENLKGSSNEVLSPGNGDIIELLDYERVRQVNKLRRHNHKMINSLSLRYDTDTKKIVQRKLRKSRHFNPKSEEHRRKGNAFSVKNNGEQSDSEISILNKSKASSGSRSRVKRSTDEHSDMDRSFSDDRGKVIIGENYQGKLLVHNEEGNEFDSEDDLGDLSYDLNGSNTEKAVSDSTNQIEKNRKIFKDGSFVYENDPDYKNYVTHHYIDEMNEKFISHSTEMSWERGHIAEAEGLKSKMGTNTVSMEKDESVSNGKLSDYIPASRGTERRRHQHQQEARGAHEARPHEARDWREGSETPQQGADPGDEDTEDEAEAGECQLSTLRVNFSELGWAQHVVAPASVEIGFCLGSCPETTTEVPEDRSKNLAKLLTLSRAISGAVSGGSRRAPCCAPRRAAAVPLLLAYSPEDIRIKSNWLVSVQTCQCQ